MQGTNARSVVGRCVVEPSRAEKARQRLAVLSAFLLGVAMLAQPTITVAADGDTTTVAMPPPVSDTGFREPSSGGSVIIRGTRPVSPAAEQSPDLASERNRTPPYMGFQPAPLYGSGWNTEYNYNGLSYAPWSAGQ